MSSPEDSPSFNAERHQRGLDRDFNLLISYVPETVGKELAAVRDLLHVILTHGTPARFEHGWGLDLPEPLRREIAARLQRLSLDAMLHVQELLRETNSPALEVVQWLRQGRWPARDFLGQSRMFFQDEGTRGMSAYPTPAFGEKLNGVLEMLRDPSDTAPLAGARKLLAFTREKAPRTPEGKEVPLEMLEPLCKRDESALFFANKMSAQLETGSVALWTGLRPHHYVPRSDEGTAGEAEDFSQADRVDIADFTHYLSLLHIEMNQQLGCQSPDMGPISRQAGGHLIHSVCEAAFLFFLRGRFKGLLAAADTILPDGSLKTPEEQALYNRERVRKWEMFCRIRGMLHSWEKASKAIEASADSPDLKNAAGHTGCMLANLERSLYAFGLLQFKANAVKMPKSTRRNPPEKDYTVRPLPERSFCQYLESRDEKTPLDVSAYSTRRGCSFTDRAVSGTYRRYQSKGSGVESSEATVSLHRHQGNPCLTDISHIPLEHMLMPEDPALITANFLAKQADRHNAYIEGMCKDFGIEEAVHKAKGKVKRIDFIHRIRKMKGRWRWLKLDRAYEQYEYLLVSRADAEALGIADRVVPLPKKERVFLEEHHGYCPPDPVMIRIDMEPPDDDDDGPPPPEPAPPEPEEKKKEQPVRPVRSRETANV